MSGAHRRTKPRGVNPSYLFAKPLAKTGPANVAGDSWWMRRPRNGFTAYAQGRTFSQHPKVVVLPIWHE